jgi:hypothetical protein
MPRTTLKKTTCRECNAPILVAQYVPHPDEEYTTGMPAYCWDVDTMQDDFAGWICEKCAFERVGEGKPGMISGPSLTFHY